MDDGIKDHKFKSQLMTLFRRHHCCGLEVKLETSIVGTLLAYVLKDMYYIGNHRQW